VLELAAHQLAVGGTQAAGLMAGSMRAARFIVPQHNTRLNRPDLLVTNHRLCDVGHLSLAVDPRAARTSVAALTEVKGAGHSTAASWKEPIDTQAPIARSSPTASS